MNAMMHTLIVALLIAAGCGERPDPSEQKSMNAPEVMEAPAAVVEVPATVDAVQMTTAATAPERVVERAAPAANTANAAAKVVPVEAEATTPLAPAAFDHRLWNSLLQAHVSADGMVDYGGFAKDARLATYLAQLSAAKDVNSWPRNERLAFWINTYNAFTIKLMIDHPSVKSIKDIKDPWKKKFFSIGGAQMDLDHVEHAEMREKLGDERIHFAIVCASFSCPQLWNKAFTAEGLDKQLDDAARRFINDPKRNTLGAKPKLSSIFDWFKGDFTKKGTLVDYINRYAANPLPAKASIGYLDYDWSLNGTR